MEQKIKSIEKGWGEGSTYYQTDKRNFSQRGGGALYVDEIKKEAMVIGKGYYNDIDIDVYKGYKDGKLIFTIEANSSLTVHFY